MLAENKKTAPVALITGSARRIGACIATVFHQHGYRVVLHYRHSHQDAQTLLNQLNDQRKDSALLIQADLDDENSYEQKIDKLENLYVFHNDIPFFLKIIFFGCCLDIPYMRNRDMFASNLFLQRMLMTASRIQTAGSDRVQTCVRVHERSPFLIA